MDAAGIEEICEVARSTWALTDAPSRTRSREVGLRALLAHLDTWPRATWQERWHAAGLDTRGCPVRNLAEGVGPRAWMTQGLEALICLRIITPSLEAFRSNQFVDFPKAFRTAAADPGLEAFFAAVEGTGTSRHFQRRAGFDVTVALSTQGIGYADLSPQSFLHYARTTRDAGLAAYSYSTYVGHLAWRVMHDTGHFPRIAPSTLRAALRAPKRSCQELVDQHGLRQQGVAGLLVQYLQRRSHDLDYSSLTSLASTLARTFWKTIETLTPDQSDLRLSEHVYLQWREAIRTLDSGKARRTEDSVLITVRAFYYDIQTWADQEPQTWALWAAPCPIPHQELRAGAARRRRTRERMADQTRHLQPLLPALVDYVEDTRATMSTLLVADTTAGDVVAVGSRTYRRLFTAADRRRAVMHGAANVRFHDEATGTTINVTLAEDTAFWQWAIVEGLRHTGARIEELLELSQLSIRQYRRPNGEVVALLVIAPSKSDRERVIPVSAELFHVLACIIRRLTTTTGPSSVPLATRYDEHERTTSSPQPFLFQRRIGQRNEVMTTGAVREMLRRVCGRISLDDPRFEDLTFVPHDFRRLFATDLVNHGLPIHIGAALLGHLNLETTRGYVAVFNEDVVRHYQTHLTGRRAVRPTEEYRPASDEEWVEFEEHFDKRKLELGNCGRPYATPCSHEHACIRCPMLRIDPVMLDRLADIETDLLTRRERAETQSWLGEIEGIDLTLSFLRSKREQVKRSSASTPTDLGLPASRKRPT